MLKGINNINRKTPQTYEAIMQDSTALYNHY